MARKKKPQKPKEENNPIDMDAIDAGTDLKTQTIDLKANDTGTTQDENDNPDNKPREEEDAPQDQNLEQDQETAQEQDPGNDELKESDTETTDLEADGNAADQAADQDDSQALLDADDDYDPDDVNKAAPPSRGFFSYVMASLIGGLLALVLVLSLQISDVAQRIPFFNSLFGLESKHVDGLREELKAVRAELKETRALADQNNIDLGQLSGTRVNEEISTLKTDIEVRFATLDERLGKVQNGDQQADTEGNQDLIEQVNSLQAELDTLRMNLEKGSAGESQGLGVLSGSLNDLRSKVTELETHLAAAGQVGVDSQALSGLAKNVEEHRDEQIKLLERFDIFASELETLKSSSVLDQGNELIKKTNENFASALALANLKTALVNGQPFINEIVALEQLNLKPELLKSIKPHAEDGIESDAALARSFQSVARQIVAAANTSTDDTDLQTRLTNTLKGLVGMRPVGMVEGAQPSAIMARVEVLLGEGKFEEALEEMKNLPQDLSEEANDWSSKLTAKVESAKIIKKINEALLTQIQSHMK